MVQVDFHILGSHEEEALRMYACRLTEKARLHGHSVYVRVADDAAAADMDGLLWTFRDRSFVPHAVDGEGAPDEPVLIGTGAGPVSGAPDVLVNMAPSAPDDPERFQRIVEIGDHRPALLQQARQRFLWYRERGIRPDHHSVETP